MLRFLVAFFGKYPIFLKYKYKIELKIQFWKDKY